MAAKRLSGEFMLGLEKPAADIDDAVKIEGSAEFGLRLYIRQLEQAVYDLTTLCDSISGKTDIEIENIDGAVVVTGPEALMKQWFADNLLVPYTQD